MRESEIKLNVYYDILDVMETSLPLLSKSNMSLGDEYVKGYEDSFLITIEYLQQIINDLEEKIGSEGYL